MTKQLLQHSNQPDESCARQGTPHQKEPLVGVVVLLLSAYRPLGLKVSLDEVHLKISSPARRCSLPKCIEDLSFYRLGEKVRGVHFRVDLLYRHQPLLHDLLQEEFPKLHVFHVHQAGFLCAAFRRRAIRIEHNARCNAQLHQSCPQR